MPTWSPSGGAERSLTALSALGWAAIILGGFCVGLGKNYPELPEFNSLPSVGLWGLRTLGGLLVLLFTSRAPIPALALTNVFGRLVDGLKGITGLAKAFGDVLSYLRLFALGLASIKLAEAFNNLAATSPSLPEARGCCSACWSCSWATASTSAWES